MSKYLEAKFELDLYDLYKDMSLSELQQECVKVKKEAEKVFSSLTKEAENSGFDSFLMSDKDYQYALFINKKEVILTEILTEKIEQLKQELTIYNKSSNKSRFTIN